MPRLLLLLLMLCLLPPAAGASGEPPPSDQALIYYNARMALREGRATEAVKLWFLRTALEDQTGRLSVYDGDFHSVTWAALGELGLCQGGLDRDEAGAGLWPLALHNWVVRNMRRQAKSRRARPFDAFALGRQQRSVAIGDVLSAPEMATLSLRRSGCLRHQLVLLSAGQPLIVRLSDRKQAAELMYFLLERSRGTLAAGRVRGRSVVEARLFDINLQLTALAAREAREQARDQARQGRLLGLSGDSAEVVREQAPDYTFPPDSEPARILHASTRWPASEWMALDPDRRRFLFDHARNYTGEDEALDRIALGLVDRLAAQGQGDEVGAWIARYEGDREAIWGGERGQRLLALDPEAGFPERAVISLHRGVQHLERGELPEAMRALAHAMQHAPDSREAEAVMGLSRRWLSYVAAQFEITDELLVTLQALVPRRDYTTILEDLMWRAAFHADRASFARGAQNQAGRDALERRLALLQPLAAGDVDLFLRRIRDGLAQSPSETLRFLDQLVERLEREEAAVRAAHLPTLARLRQLLQPLSSEAGATGGQARLAAELLARTQAIIEGLGGLGPDASSRDRARSLAPTGEVFAGSIRLAPADPLPWPFVAAEAAAPSVFAPLQLTPVEWESDVDEPIFGWSIGG